MTYFVESTNEVVEELEQRTKEKLRECIFVVLAIRSGDSKQVMIIRFIPCSRFEPVEERVSES